MFRTPFKDPFNELLWSLCLDNHDDANSMILLHVVYVNVFIGADLRSYSMRRAISFLSRVIGNSYDYDDDDLLSLL